MSIHSIKRFFLIGILCLNFIFTQKAFTQETLTSDDLPKDTSVEQTEPTDKVYRAPTVEVIGEGKDAMDTIPGAGEVVPKKELEIKKPINLQETIRDLPGVNIRAEDNIGLIPNIGIRGLNPDRSEKLLILEDGVPAGLAPYTVNAAYYVPPIERMEKVELLKGSASILYGPQTVGGVLNLITPDIPREFRSKVEALGGTDAYTMGHGTFGKTFGAIGFDTSMLYKRGNGFRDASGFNLTNVTAKTKVKFSDKTNLTIKGNFQDQHSSQTYLGLTENLFASSPEFNPSPQDRLDLRRFDVVSTLQHFFSDDIELLTNIYYNQTRRTWNRQDFSRNTDFAPPPPTTVATYGDTSISGGAIYMLSSFGSRDRSFAMAGVEPRVKIDYDAFGKKHRMEAGVRFHWEGMLDERNNRSTFNSNPITWDQDLRQTYAGAFFFQNTFRVTDHLSLIPGFRMEDYTQSRDITVATGQATKVEKTVNTFVPLPGFGITYQLPKETTLFTGIHRGFSPPRTAQAISSTGQDAELDAELSWNTEFGVRTQPFPWMKAESTFFYMDFANEIVPDSESGVTAATDTDTNAGKTRHLGVEFSNSLDLLGAMGYEGKKQLILNTRYTFVSAQNNTPGSPFYGNQLPYAPQHLGSVGMRFVSEDKKTKKLTIGIEGIYSGSQFANQANTVAPSNDGLVGLIPSYWLLNAYARYKIPKTKLEASLLANNILNHHYIVSRAPQGAFPGAFLQILGEVRYDFF